mmetsp:Transcript_42261/g.99132  ORF Transcript_42261/g.99132 Transcript_42261/m.99132 type:complete len:225 (+) Transcript_42261:462-1136(+)
MRSRIGNRPIGGANSLSTSFSTTESGQIRRSPHDKASRAIGVSSSMSVSKYTISGRASPRGAVIALSNASQAAAHTFSPQSPAAPCRSGPPAYRKRLSPPTAGAASPTRSMAGTWLCPGQNVDDCPLASSASLDRRPVDRDSAARSARRAPPRSVPPSSNLEASPNTEKSTTRTSASGRERAVSVAMLKTSVVLPAPPLFEAHTKLVSTTHGAGAPPSLSGWAD